MLSIKPLSCAKESCDYYMQAAEYYQRDATATTWLGLGKSFLNLDGSIEQQTFLQLLEGRLSNGQKLQNPQGEHRPGFDMTFSAPKSVSILVGLGVAPELVKFHDEAVQHAIQEIEKEFAETRVCRHGEVIYEKTGNLLVAAFRQPSSRANDPALHTHCVTLNMTFHEGKVRSLASDKSRVHGVVEQIQNHAHYGGILYRQHLANSLKEAGFQLRLTGHGLFEIEGMPEVVLTEFSKRRAAIEQLMEDKGWTSAKSATLATLMSRDAKEEHTLDALCADWRQRAREINFDAHEFMQHRGKLKTTLGFSSLVKDKLDSFLRKLNDKSISEADAARACIHVAIETLSQRTSVFTERELKFESLKHSLIYEKPVDQKTIIEAIQIAKKEQQLYEGHCPENNQSVLTTPWLLTLEAETITRIENNKDILKAIASKSEIQKFQQQRSQHLAHPMTPSQKEAMTCLLLAKDRYFAIQGYAGVAKTSMLAEARLLIEEKGYQLRGITVASSAANELQSKARISSDVFPVVYRELKEAKAGSLSKTIFIVDESSMLSSSQGHALMKQVERVQARLILIGDKAQLPSVNNGRIFGLIQDYGIQMTVMHDIVRQKNPELKDAVIAVTEGNIQKALQKLQIEELPNHEARIQWIAQKWLSMDVEQRKGTLLFAPTHQDRKDITVLIRNGLKQENTLQGTSYVQKTLKMKTIEPIQQRFIAYYQEGDVVRFNQDFQKYSVAQGQYYTVGTILPKHRRDNVLPLINIKGKVLHFALKALPHYKIHTAPFERVMELYQKSDLELQAGDKVMWTRNFKAENIRNGELLVLQKIEENHLRFLNQDKQIVTIAKDNPALTHLDYSYVLTNYKVQGKEAPYGIGLMESYHRFGATKKNFYVQVSRAIHGMTLVTDNKIQLQEAIQKHRDEKDAVLDKLSVRQLEQHEARFKNQSQFSIQPVIDKKIELKTRELGKELEH